GHRARGAAEARRAAGGHRPRRPRPRLLARRHRDRGRPRRWPDHVAGSNVWRALHPVALRRGSRRRRMSYFVQYTIDGLTAGAFYALVALGYTIVYGIIRLINFAHGDLTMIGSFIGWTVLVSFGLQRLPMVFSIAIAV